MAGSNIKKSFVFSKKCRSSRANGMVNIVHFFGVLQKMGCNNWTRQNRHSGDLNTELVWCTNGQKLSDCQIVRYSNAI